MLKTHYNESDNRVFLFFYTLSEETSVRLFYLLPSFWTMALSLKRIFDKNCNMVEIRPVLWTVAWVIETVYKNVKKKESILKKV